jgi:hypothetical protein
MKYDVVYSSLTAVLRPSFVEHYRIRQCSRLCWRIFSRFKIHSYHNNSLRIFIQTFKAYMRIYLHLSTFTSDYRRIFSPPIDIILKCWGISKGVFMICNRSKVIINHIHGFILDYSMIFNRSMGILNHHHGFKMDFSFILFLVEKSLTNINCLIAWLLVCPHLTDWSNN